MSGCRIRKKRSYATLPPTLHEEDQTMEVILPAVISAIAIIIAAWISRPKTDIPKAEVPNRNH
jgi:hypothetical protein